jgi:hypothetical protein
MSVFMTPSIRIQLNGEDSPPDCMPASVRTVDELPSAPTMYLLKDALGEEGGAGVRSVPFDCPGFFRANFVNDRGDLETILCVLIDYHVI